MTEFSLLVHVSMNSKSSCVLLHSHFSGPYISLCTACENKTRQASSSMAFPGSGVAFDRVFVLPGESPLRRL